MDSEHRDGEAGFLKSGFPVFFPSHAALTLQPDEFENFLKKDLQAEELVHYATALHDDTAADADTFTMVSEPTSTTVDVVDGFQNIDVDDTPAMSNASAMPELDAPAPTTVSLPHQAQDSEVQDMENKMLTKNADVAYRSTTNPLVDLFTELETVVSGPIMRQLLEAAWSHDELGTLKIIFNARSIHLGKSDRHVFYRCAGWLAQNHPLTLVSNLRWLCRPIIEKKAEKKDPARGDDVVVMVEDDIPAGDDPRGFDVRHGVSHGYWKDLLNILALAANDKLGPLHDPKDLLNFDGRGKHAVHSRTQPEARELRHGLRDDRHEAAIARFADDPVYRALHLTVARLFAEQLQSDLAALRGDRTQEKRNISLCAKWAPSAQRFHDKHTFIVTSIAEILHPQPEPPARDRETYLRHAREAYRKDVAALRAHLAVVERDISAKAFSNIKYERVPSIAMNNYATLFAIRDPGRFDEYVSSVAVGRSRISGATLLPSTLVHAARKQANSKDIALLAKNRGLNGAVQARLKDVDARVLDGQWKTLVQRIKDSGALSNCIAICDVSGSMDSPHFPDGTCPIDSSIGLALLIAEVTKPPFGGAFITFSSRPALQRIDLSQGLSQKVRQLQASDWHMSTDFEAVFEKLILPMAVENRLPPDEMLQRVFVLSDMQFDQAKHGDQHWSTSYQRIAESYRLAGYEMPELVFWNLAGGRAGYGAGMAGDPTAPKPVTAADIGTALVSGYSQGMLKVFMDNGAFDGEDDTEEVIKTVDEDDGTVVVERATKRPKMDPLAVVKKAIGHKAYDMLRVMD